MSFPNIVIAGAPKCGTSSLFRWLTAHPRVCAPQEKETRYLLDIGSPLQRTDGGFQANGLDGYAKLFADCAGAEAIAEATPDYLYQDTASRVLAQVHPRPLIVFLLRRPATRVYSHYQYARNNMAILPRDLSFTEFVQAARRHDPLVTDRRNLGHAIDYSRYARHLTSWFERLGSESLRIYLTEELALDPLRILKDIATAAGLDVSFYDTYRFDRTNETIAVRAQWAQRLCIELAPRIRSGRLKGWARAAYIRINARAFSPLNEEDARTLRDLDDDFAEDNVALERLTGLDLAIWDASPGT